MVHFIFNRNCFPFARGYFQRIGVMVVSLSNVTGLIVERMDGAGGDGSGMAVGFTKQLKLVLS
jgi:hypothetical protein